MRVKLHRENDSLLWLECTLAEAEVNIFPLLSVEQIELSKDCIAQVLSDWEVGDEEDNSKHPHDIYSKKIIKYPTCFNIDINLTKVEPAPAFLPFSHMWNGYSPYSLIEEICFNNFEDLKNKYKG